MQKQEITAQVIDLLRQTALSGSSREIDPETPLGSQGLGLDSLALIEFTTVLERQYQIQMPDDLWAAGGQLTLARFIEIIAATHTSATPAAAASRPEPPVESAQTSAAAPLGIIGASIYRLYNQDRYYILDFDLGGQTLPTFTAGADLQFRTAAPADAAALDSFWNALDYRTIDGANMDQALFHRRLAAGAHCLTAWQGAEIVAMDWIFKQSYACPYTGLRFSWPAESCYGGELWERPGLGGRGIGMALLAFSLAEAQKIGYQRQVTLVNARNTRMLGAAVQLFGFQTRGEIRTLRFLGHPFSRWRNGANTSYGHSVRL